MLLPRPEIRIATRFGSRMMGRGPSFGVAAPRWGSDTRVTGTTDRASAFTSLNSTNLPVGFLCARVTDGELREVVLTDDGNHSYAAVECPYHFLRRDIAALT